MRRSIRLFSGLALVLVAIPVGLYGLFAMLYGGESGGGDTYVELGGSEIDADVFGGALLVIAAIAALASTFFLRRRRCP